MCTGTTVRQSDEQGFTAEVWFFGAGYLILVSRLILQLDTLIFTKHSNVYKFRLWREF